MDMSPFSLTASGDNAGSVIQAAPILTQRYCSAKLARVRN
jgi:hypothetical protein